jgi:hypothetical protein
MRSSGDRPQSSTHSVSRFPSTTGWCAATHSIPWLPAGSLQMFSRSQSLALDAHRRDYHIYQFLREPGSRSCGLRGRAWKSSLDVPRGLVADFVTFITFTGSGKCHDASGVVTGQGICGKLVEHSGRRDGRFRVTHRRERTVEPLPLHSGGYDRDAGKQVTDYRRRHSHL